MNLQSRVLDYDIFMNSPIYHACYEFLEDHNKVEILYIEKYILDITKNKHNIFFSSEYREINPHDFDVIVKNILKKFNIKYIHHNPVQFELVKIKTKKKQRNDFLYYTNKYIELPVLDRIKLDSHQIECINSINNILSLENKCYIEGFCGIGKSVIGFYKLLHYNFSILVVPSLLLVDQFYRDYIKNSNYNDYIKDYVFLCVCSKKSYHCSTNKKYITNFIKDNKKIIIIVTYMSLDILFNCIDKTHPNIIVFDECHHVISPKISRLLSTYENKLTKYIFMSATIPIDFDFGKLAYRFSYKDAVDNYICKECDVIIDVYSDDNKFNIYNSIARHSLSTGNYKIITYHNTVNNSDSEISVNNFIDNIDKIKNSFLNISKEEFPELDINCVIIKSITSATKNKLDIIKEFDECDSNTPYILASCRSVNEGVDIKNANCICFCEPKNSVVDIIQNIGRISRNVTREKNYKKSTIIIPMLLSSNFDTIIEVIESLKNNSDIFLYTNGKICNNIEINDKIKDNIKKSLNDKLYENSNIVTNDVIIDIPYNNRIVNCYKYKNKNDEILENINNNSNEKSINCVRLSFLKNNSLIEDKFIKDFFMIAKEEYMDSEFIINIELICNWLDTRKDNLKKILQDNFEEDYDYTIEKIYIKRKVGSTMKEEILLTPNCFKELCMISQSKRAKEVRKYFIEMEKLIKRYYETIKEAMYKEIGLLKNNQKPKTDLPKGGVLYVIEAQNTITLHKIGKINDIKGELYKIGKSGDMKKRLGGYNTGNANDILPLFIIPVKDIKNAEDCIKRSCKRFQYRKYKEVYQINYQVLVDSLETCKLLTDGLAKHFEEQTIKESKISLSRIKGGKHNYFIYVDKNV